MHLQSNLNLQRTKMSNVVKILSTQDDIILTGATNKIMKNPRARMYLRNNLDCNVQDDSIRIKRGNSDINQIIDDIKVVTKYAACSLEYDDSVSSDIKTYQQDELDFSVFSEKARTIRNNEVKVSDLEDFKNSLVKNMPARTLYELQMLSAYHMAFAQNACNFSVPGAGKTSVVYGAYCYLKNLPEDDPKHVDYIFIIGPLSSFGPWESEYFECFGKEVESMRLIGGIKKADKENYLYSSSPRELTLTSYQSVVGIREDIIAFLRRNKTMLVLDEAHKIKNTQGAITATSVMELAQYAKARVVLTGTPAPNGYEDLYNLFKFLWPSKNVIRFTIPQLKNMSLDENDERIGTLLNQIEPFFIRVTKKDLHLPPISVEKVTVEMSQEQRDIYDVIESRFVSEIQEDIANDYVSDMTKAKTIRLMQAATNPLLLKEPLKNAIGEDFDFNVEDFDADNSFVSKVLNYKKVEVPAKFLKTLDIVNDILNRGEKVVIWATFIKNIESLSEFLNKKGIENRMLYGSTPVEREGAADINNEFTREGIVKEFNSPNSSFKVIIANPFAVAESISLHKACHNAIYLERSFNAAHFLQSKDRIHRYGLPANVTTHYYFLISENSIDETIDQRLVQKEDRLTRIIESSPIPLFSNVLEDEGIEDVKAIIRNYVERSKAI